ncbi:hypothetical protein [Companilactobacillus baiquanensis]|uniref:AbrB family transcriptional regulator n=1 Tax=Companilactobacillus baiquanensis TaxID=2486005 RepID=A0ABW1UV29_9LACO|nr:hypothetical protein [Companilactobacillus baiquanensis]
MYTKEQILRAAKEIGLSAELMPEGTKATFISPDGSICSKLEDNPIEEFFSSDEYSLNNIKLDELNK